MKKLNWQLIRGIISAFILIGAVPTLILIFYFTDKWRHAEKYLEDHIPNTEFLLDTTYNADPSFKGTFIVYYMSDKGFVESVSSLDDRLQKVSEFEGFYRSLDDCSFSTTYSFNVPNDQLKGLAFNEKRKTYDNDYITNVENVKIVAIARLF